MTDTVKTTVTFTTETVGSSDEQYPDNITTLSFDGTDATVTTMCAQFAQFLRAAGYTYVDTVEFKTENDF
jgi:hypothetical protein